MPIYSLEGKLSSLPINLRFIAPHSLHPGSLLVSVGLMELNQPKFLKLEFHSCVWAPGLIKPSAGHWKAPHFLLISGQGAPSLVGSEQRKGLVIKINFNHWQPNLKNQPRLQVSSEKNPKNPKFSSVSFVQLGGHANLYSTCYNTEEPRGKGQSWFKAMVLVFCRKLRTNWNWCLHWKYSKQITAAVLHIFWLNQTDLQTEPHPSSLV